MSFSEYSNKKKKKYSSFAEWSDAKYGTNTNAQYETNDDDDIAPVGGNKESWVKSGAFDDGYDFGDVTKTILGTVGDVAVGVGKGFTRMLEGVTDLAGYGIAGVADLLGADTYAGYIKAATKDNATDELWADASDNVDQYSVLGDKADMVSEGLGQVGAIILTGGIGAAAGLGTFGTTALTTGVTGLSGMGSGMGEAYNSGASDGDAFKYGLLKGGIEAGTELLFGGLGKTSKAIGLGKSGIPLDDFLAKSVTKKITNQTAKNLVQYGIKATGEGVEEVIAGYLSAHAKKGTYMPDEDFSKILEDEKLLESFIVGTFTSAIAQSGYIPGMTNGSLREANKTGRDFITGYTKNEQTVIDKEVENRVAEAEKNGKKLTKREIGEIEEKVKNDLEKGYISIDSIESALGGKTFEEYNSITEREKALIEEISQLENTPKEQITVKQSERLTEAREELKNLTNKTELKTRLSDEVFNLVKDSRLVESYNEKARKGQAFEADLTKYTGKQREAVERAVKSGVLNNTNRSHELVNVLSKIEAEKGITFDYTNNEKLKETGFAIEGKSVNAFVKGGAVTLNVQSSKAWQSTVGHEITHVLEGTEAYSELRNALFTYAESKGELASRKATLTELYNGLDADIDAELTADLVGDYLFTDGDFIKNLTGNKNLFQKIYDEIKYLCKVATGKELTEIEKVKREFDKAWKELYVKGVSKETDGKVEYSLSGINKDGIEVYETSEETMNLTWNERKAKYLDVMKNEYRGRTAKFVRNGHTYYAKFDQRSINKHIYGDNRSSKDGLKALTKAGADGDVFDLVENSQYTGSQKNKKNNTKADYFDYFIKTVQIDGKVFDLVADVEKNYGADGGYVYSLALRENKTIKASPADGTSQSEPLKSARNAFDDKIVPQNPNDVKTQFSLSEDTQGRKLSAEQQEYFKDSKILDENGNLKVMYHGTPEAFTIFDKKKAKSFGTYGNGFYFSDSNSHAGTYGETLSVYLNIKNPLKNGTNDITKEQVRKFVEAIAENEDYGIENYGYDATIESVVDSVYGKGDFGTILDLNISCVGNMVEAVELFNEVNGTNYDGIIAPTETVAFYPNQIKNIDNAKPTTDPDIRFSLSESVEETKDLVAVHNLSEEKLLKSLELGGLPMPSIAIARAKEGHNGFGNISLVFNKDTIDPQNERSNKVYSGDAWTPVYPRIDHKINNKAQAEVEERINSLIPENVARDLGGLHIDSYNLEQELNRNNGSVTEVFRNNTALKYAFLVESGENLELPTKNKRLARYSNHPDEAIIRVAETVSKEKLQGILKEYTTEQVYEVEPEIRNAVNEYFKEKYKKLPPKALEALLKKDALSRGDIDDYAREALDYLKNGVEQEVDYSSAKTLIDEVIDSPKYEKWVKDLFANIVEKEGIRNNKDIFTPSGNRRSFEALHYEHNLENVIRAMRESGEKGLGTFGRGNIFGASTTEYKSIADIKDAAKTRLQNMPQEEYEAIRKGFSERFFELANSLPIHKDSFTAIDDAANMLIEAVSKFKTKSGIANYLRSESKGWANYSDNVTDDLIQLVSEIRQMPVDYFEAKPQRAVGFDEVATAIIPDTTNAELKQLLTDNGVNFIEYESGNEQARLEVLNSLEDAKFSLSKQGEQIAPVGNYSTPLNETALAPTKEDVVENVEAVEDMPEDYAPITEEEFNEMQKDMPFFDDLDAPPEIEDGYYEDADTMALDDKTLNNIGKSLRETLSLTAEESKAIQGIVQEYSTSETLNRDNLFETIKENFGEKVLKEKIEGLAEIKRYLRTTKINVSQKIKSDIADYNDFRKSIGGKIRISKDGLPVDTIYKELSSLYPTDFSDEIWNETDQFLRMVEVAKMDAVATTTYSLDDEVIQEAVNIISNEVRGYKENTARMAAEELSREALDSIAPLKATQIADGSRGDALLYESLDNYPVETVEQKVAEKIRAVEAELADNKQLRREAMVQYDKDIEKLSNEYLSKKNKNSKLANNLIRRIANLGKLKASVDADYSKRISDLEARLERMNEPTYSRALYKQEKMQEHAKWAENLLGDTSTWKDKKIGLQYATNTERRNLRDIVRDANGNVDIAKADAIDDALNGQYNREEAAKKRELAEARGKYADLKITKAEDAYIQMLGELRYNPDTTLTDEVVTEYYQKHKNKIDAEKVDKIIDLARQDYDSWLTRVNAELRKQGMKEIPYRQGYFPHFTEPKQNFIQKLLNWKTQDNEIPTSIAGLTETFKPVKSWQSFDKTRYSDETDYSFTKGFDTYSQGVLDWIYHLDTLQKRRAVENHIRFTHSDEGIQKRIKEVYANEEFDANEAQAQIEHILAEAKNPLNNFVQDFTTHTNILAGKKNSLDRTVEQATNRHIYSVMTNVQNRMSANMVLANVRSALTNFIPITQSWSQVSPMRSLQATKDVIANAIKEDGVVEKSTFLTNRLREPDNLHNTTWDKVLDKAGIMFEVIDNFSSQVIWRSKYNQNLADGMTESQAIKNADQFAENVMAGRSKGNEPTLFNAKNPLVKAFTMFQLEVNNQYGYFFKDVPNDLKTETNHWKLNLAKGYTTAFVGAYVYNELLSKLTGSDAALDPIGIVVDLLKDLGLLGDDEEKEPDEVITNLIENVGEELPFVGGTLFGGGRIPISSAVPYGDNGLVKGVGDFVTDVTEGNWGNIGKEMMNPLLNIGLPVGGGQIKKTTQGLKMFNTDEDHPVAGSYTDSGALRFPVDDTLGNRIQAGIFGQYASENAREYFDNGYAPLKEKQIQEYVDVDLPIADYWDYREGLKGLKTNAEKADYINSLDIEDWQKNLLMNNILDRKEDVDMSNYDDYNSYEEFDYAQKNPEKYAFAKSVGGYSSYKTYSADLNDIKADKDSSGKTINGSRKEKVLDYINNLDADYETKIILFKSEYPSDDTYNQEIIEYINNRNDLTYEERVTIYTELGFTVKDGYIYWD